ncbi:MAG: hypothetical protein GEV10_01070 [Streptosporangiales bacterium]|nr:hypothetical protein [Streptosporangiales bacterium]
MHDGSWPFTDVRTVGRRGDLLVLEGTAPDGVPVTITRLAPGPATDPATHRRFHEAVEEMRRRTGPGDPPITWWDTRTLSPWIATYADTSHRGADQLAGYFAPSHAPGRYPPPPAYTPAPAGPAPDAALASVGRRFLPRIIAAGAAVVVLVMTLAVVGAVVRSGSEATPSESSTLAGVPTGYPTSSSSPSMTTGGPTATPAPKPTLRRVKPKAVYGPTWKSGDDTYTMAFAGDDYAFRAPGDFDCFRAGATSRDTYIRCTKLLAVPEESRRLTVINQVCAKTTCTSTEWKSMVRRLGVAPKKWKTKDKTTRYAVETFRNEQNGEKYFRYYLSHTYPDDDGKLGRHVSAVAETPVGKYAGQLQKTVNDIRTQSG